MSIQLVSEDDDVFTVNRDLAQLSSRLRDMLTTTSTNISIDIPYPAETINLILECMNELLSSPTNVTSDYIFYQLVPLIETVMGDYGLIELIELTYIADYLEVDPLINVFAYLLSQYLLEPDIETDEQFNQAFADIVYATDDSFEYNDLAPAVIKYIRKHHFLAFGMHYKYPDTEEIDRIDVIEYTVADLLTINPLGVKIVKALGHTLLIMDHKNLTSFDGLETINANEITALQLLDNDLLDPYRDTHNVRSPFINFTRLGDLALSYNLLERLPNLFFDGLVSLTSLNLESNLLIDLPGGVSKLTKLRELNLNTNRLTNIKSLSTLTTLKNLSLDGNQLTRLTYAEMKSFPKLQKFSVSYNNINQIDEDTFRNNTSLQIMSLDENFIDNLTINHFSYITSLTNLSLSTYQMNNLDTVQLAIYLPNLTIFFEDEDEDDVDLDINDEDEQ